ncbi:unnamed protein product [Effrenium voratum]|nr:unnamed protein product [Effrenium voratum]
MGCTSVHSVHRAVHGSHALGSALGACVIVEDDCGKVYEENSVSYVEPQLSFNSMGCKNPSAPPARTPPIASTHQRHVERLNDFLKRVDANKAGLREEVKHRRSELSSTRISC